MKKVSFMQVLEIGILLFSMFFGAGNLIFAPSLGAQAASAGWLALAGFVCTAVVLPILAVIIISRYKDARDMISTIHPLAADIFMTLVYLLIGPCIAIPRTASTSFEMFGWLFGQNMYSSVIYTVLFFGASYIAASHPGKLKDILGKIMGPILVGLVLVLTLGSLFIAAPAQAAPTEQWASNPFMTGFINGYQTMDILAAFCFGIVILLNIRQAGFETVQAQRSVLKKAAVIAGCFLAALYSLLAVSGMRFSALFQAQSNGAQILSSLAALEFGSAGQILVSLIFLCACFNVCSGLLSCCSEFFSKLFVKIPYKTWLIVFTLAGICVSVFGLDFILAFSAPILGWICPIAIALLAWGWIRSLIKKGPAANK